MIHIVFDLDGTLADTQRIHEKIESDFLASKWVRIEPVLIGKTYAGRSPSEWIPECLHENNVVFHTDEIDHFIDSKDLRVIDLLKTGDIVLMDGVKEVLKTFFDQGMKMGISSWACREFIDEFLIYFDLDMIDATTSANEVVHKKPAPDVFLASFEKLEKIHGKPTEKWVIGDGKTDIIGGNASGAKSILCYHDYDIPYTYRIDAFRELLDIIK